MFHPSSRRAAIVLAACWFTTLAGCEAFRMHDAARLHLATEAAELSDQIRSDSGNAFSAMEHNLDQVQGAQDRVGAILDEQRYATFLLAMGEMTGQELLEELEETEENHAQVVCNVQDAVTKATANVNESMARIELIGDPSTAAESETELQKTLARLDQQLGRFESVAKHATKALDLLGTKSGQGEQRLEAALNELRSKLDIFRDATANDPNAAEALQLLLQAGQEIAASELKRLSEMKRHLSTLQRIQNELNARETDFQTLMLAPAKKTAHERIDKKKLVNFIESRLSDGVQSEEQEAALKFVASVGLLLFVEEPLDRAAEAAADAELHRHSIRLSGINARQQMDLIHHVTLGLQVFYKGGITPEEVASLVIAAAEVGALAFIGARL